MAGLIPFNKKNDNAISPTPLRPFDMIDDFFGEAFSNLPSFKRDLTSGSFKVDVSETENEYLIEAELPDVKKESINLNLNEDKLTISVEKREKFDAESEDRSYIHRERRYSSMQRSMYLANADSDPEKVHAKLEHGLLKVTVPKKDDFKQQDHSQKIKIE